MLSLSGTAKISGGVRDMKTSFPGFHPTTDFEQSTDVHIADNLIWNCKMLFKLFHKESLMNGYWLLVMGY